MVSSTRSLLLTATLSLSAPLGMGCGGPSVNLDVASLEVVHATPHHGAVGVGVEVLPVVGFSEAVDLATGTVVLELEGESGYEVVPSRLVAQEEGKAVMLVPDEVLQAKGHYRVRIASIESDSGLTLQTPYVSNFVTDD